MNWNNEWNTGGNWPTQPPISEKPPIVLNPKPTNLWDELERDQLLKLWEDAKQAVERAQENEMELRKYIADRAFPNAEEGTNTIPLENGYELKLNKKFNYKLNSDNAVIETTLDKISKTGNQGTFIADRLVSWKASFLLTEYRTLIEAAEAGSNDAQEILALIGEMLVVEDAAPELKIKEPKKGKK